MAVLAVSNILQGGTVLVNGIPSDDLIFRYVTFLLPLLLVPIGIALFRVAPFVPQKKRTITKKRFNKTFENDVRIEAFLKFSERKTTCERYQF